MKGKRGQETQTLLIILVAVAVGVMLIWGFSTQWGGAQEKADPYLGGTNLNQLSDVCSVTSDDQIYCTSGVKVVNSLTLAQLKELKLLLPSGKCYNTKGELIDLTKETTACDTAKKGIWKTDTKEINFYTLQAKVTCNDLAQANLITGRANANCA